MKLLIIDVNNEHSSDMERNYINALTTATEVYYYGPGYSTEDEFKMGLKAYISLLNGIYYPFVNAVPPSTTLFARLNGSGN